MNVMKLFCVVWFFMHAALYSNESLETELRINGKSTLKALQPLRDNLLDQSVIIYGEGSGRRVTYGTVMSADGYILTKASELDFSKSYQKKKGHAEKFKIRLGLNELYEEVELVANDPQSDLALLKIDAAELQPVNFINTDELKQGTLVLSNGASTRYKRRARLGIISANTRAVNDSPRVKMGLQLVVENENLTVRKVVAKSTAELAGVKSGDIIEFIDSQAVKKLEDVFDVLKQKSAKEVVELKLLRKGNKMSIKVKLEAKKVSDKRETKDRNDTMSGLFSRRRDGFSKIIQVDIPVADFSCGGPLLDLEGNGLGIVIARANRAETFVLPSEIVKQTYKKLLLKSK